MNIVVPMAGIGKRFVDAGYTVPKPMIPVQGVPMYARAVESLPIAQARRLIFICLKEHLDIGLRDDIYARYHLLPTIIELDGATTGQAVSVLAARYYIDNDEPLLIHNADTVVRSATGHLFPPVADGMVSVFKPPPDTEDRWSYAQTIGTRVIRMAEKEPVGPWASTGLYWWKRGKDFVRYARFATIKSQRVRGEYYVAPLYNDLIDDEGLVVIDQADAVVNMGTPEDLLRLETGNGVW